jgi:uncharacterized membrane protein
MISFENTIEIQLPVKEVFEFVANFENTPKWNYFVTNVRQIEGSAPGAGAVYHQRRIHDEQTYRVTDYKTDHSVAIKTIKGSTPALERHMVFESTANGTRIRDQWNLELSTNPLVERLGKGRVKSAVAENLGKLKQLMETHETRLQDGRLIKL